jgi:hypothetical protein
LFGFAVKEKLTPKFELAVAILPNGTGFLESGRDRHQTATLPLLEVDCLALLISHIKGGSSSGGKESGTRCNSPNLNRSGCIPTGNLTPLIVAGPEMME